MPRFVYVECRGFFMPANVLESVSFDAITIVAESEDKVYALGPGLILQQRAAEGDATGHGDGQFLNDYVYEVPALYDGLPTEQG